VVAHIKADEIDKALAAMRAAERLSIDLSYYKVMPVGLCSPFTLGCPARWICLLACSIPALLTRLWLGYRTCWIRVFLCTRIK
jgi:hypothetical protein